MEQGRYILWVRLAAIFSMVVALLVLSGWLFDIEIFKNFNGINTMKFNAALCFLLLGLSVWFSTLHKKAYVLFSSLLSLLVILLAGITLAQDLLNFNIHIDELFSKSYASSDLANPFPRRMAPTTSLCFILIGFSLISLKSATYLVKVGAQYTLHLVSLISFVAILGYLYQVPAFYQLSFLASMAVHTALTFHLLSVSITLLNPSIGLTSLFTGNAIGNIMAKRLIPFVTIIILVLGYFRMEVHRLNFINVEFGIALFAVSFLVVSMLIIANTASHLNKIDLKRHKAELSLKILNKTLEQRVEERTKDLKESEGKFYKIFKMSPVGLMMSDMSTGRFLEVNQSFADLTGYSKEEATGKTPVELGLIYQDESEKHNQLLKQQGYLKNQETYYYTKSGEKRDSLMSVEIIDMGEKRVALTVLSDITEQKIIEQQLKEAKRIAEESSVAKERFMANMSHEIRTPMNAIIGFTNLIEKSTLNKEQGEYLDFIKSSGENLLVLINDILDYSKIEAGMMPLEQVPFKIADLSHSVEIMFSEKAREKGLALIREIDKTLPEIVIGDPTRLTQILINLIGNAIKFTKQGSVKVTISLLSAAGQQIKVGFSVKDTGIGIPADKQKEVFERFMQASNETTRNYGGTGLGLSIVKRLVELQEGEISIKSIDNEGTEFYIILPFMAGEEKPVDNTEVVTDKVEIRKFEKELKVLLAEDNVMNQILARKVLTRFGCDVDIAENGGIAVEMVRNKKYDLILMDIQMPIMDGYTAAKVMRDELKIATPIIAMTAHVMAGEREKCIGFGMTDYISKPFKVEDLYSLIVQYTAVS